MSETVKPSIKSSAVGWLATAISLFAIDLLWLGLVARPVYQRAIGHLLSEQTNWVAAILFYLFYVSVIWAFAVRGKEPVSAARQGAWLGFVSYGVYDLTNWAVMKNWPAYIVPIDWGWGVILTAAVAWCGAKASGRTT